MKFLFREQTSRGLTRTDVLVAVMLAVLLVVLVMAMPRREARITCVANLRQVGMALRVWEEDNGSGNTNSQWSSLLETNAQTVGLNAGQVAWINAMGITNFGRSAKILQCSSDKETPTTTSTAGLKIRISYFLNMDASAGFPQEIMAGDDNLAIGGIPAKPGVQMLPSNALVSWTRTRHRFVGNIALADGSVEQTSSVGLQSAAAYSFMGTPFATNRLAIP